jgi:SNF family Na+-dependent transporter
MGGLGNIIGAVWFLMLFLAAITSSLSMYQPAVAFLMEAYGINRKQASRGVLVIALIGSVMTLWYTGNGVFWSTLDFWVGTFLIFVMAGVEIIAFGWLFGMDRGWKELHAGALMQIPGVVRFVMKYLAPIYLIVVFVGFSIQNLPASLRAVGDSPSAMLAMGLIGVTLIGLLFAVRAGEKRWRDAGIDINDDRPLDADLD